MPIIVCAQACYPFMNSERDQSVLAWLYLDYTQIEVWINHGSLICIGSDP